MTESGFWAQQGKGSAQEPQTEAGPAHRGKGGRRDKGQLSEPRGPPGARRWRLGGEWWLFFLLSRCLTCGVSTCRRALNRTSAACGREWGRGGPREERDPQPPGPARPRTSILAHVLPTQPSRRPAAVRLAHRLRLWPVAPAKSETPSWLPSSAVRRETPRVEAAQGRSRSSPPGRDSLRPGGRGPAEAEAGVARRRPDARPRSVRAGTRSCGSGGSCSRPASTRPRATAATTATAPWRMARKSLESGCSWRRQRGGVRSASTCATCPW